LLLKARVALFGGTFDPVHDAHLQIAAAALRRFGLAKILFVPAANPPHKTDAVEASFEDRVHMLELACASEPAFEVSRIEEGTECSYSILTIERLRAAGVGPPAFLIGADAFAEIRTWHRWREVVQAVEFIVVTRRGAAWDTPEGAVVHELNGIDAPASSSAVRAALASSSGVRAAGAKGSAEVPVPAAVLAYIRACGLYQSQPL
jgi:nicotinate-nucleotide adenylyltransferase